jgi:general secretion pathway protein K
VTIRRPGSIIRQRGFALLIVLWTLVLLTLLETQLVKMGRGETQLAANLRGAAIAEAAADGAVEEAIFHLLDTSSRRWIADGSVHLIRGPRTVVEVRVEDEAGKVNPNIASEGLLRALLRLIGADADTAASLTKAIVDRRTKSAEPGSTDAKAAQGTAGASDEPPGALFESVDELGEIPGMTAELVAGLRPHLSVYTKTDPLRSTADPVVATAIRDSGSTASATDGGVLQIASIIAVARGPDGARFARRAVIRLSGDVKNRPWKVLEWTRPSR